jgi:carbon monoxide dehydrogenase subunit G
MKHNHLYFRILALSALILTGIIFSVNAHSQNKEEFDLSGFTKIKNSTSADLYITQGPQYKFVVEAKDKNSIEKIVAEVKDKTLKIKSKPGSWNLGKMKIYVTLPKLEALSISGSSNTIADKTIKSDEFSLAISGSGDVKFKDIQTNVLNIVVSGSGDVMMAGNSTSNIQISVSGSGDIDLQDVETKNANISISGSGDVKVFATETLNSKTSGSGDVQYKGGAQVNARSTGSGSITSM